VCDACAARDEARHAAGKAAGDCMTPQERRRRRWIALVGTRYATFHREQLPAGIKPHVAQVLSWAPHRASGGEMGSRGIGLMGPSRTGKSPLLFALGQQLYLAGHEVFPTSGIAFQRAVHRSVE